MSSLLCISTVCMSPALSKSSRLQHFEHDKYALEWFLPGTATPACRLTYIHSQSLTGHLFVNIDGSSLYKSVKLWLAQDWRQRVLRYFGLQARPFPSNNTDHILNTESDRWCEMRSIWLVRLRKYFVSRSESRCSPQHKLMVQRPLIIFKHLLHRWFGWENYETMDFIMALCSRVVNRSCCFVHEHELQPFLCSNFSV